MATKNIETVSSVVESINAKSTGIKVAGEWLNISQYHPIAPLPQVGQRVEIQVERTDKGPWINSLQVLDGGTVSASSSTRDRTITRLAVLKAAAEFCGHYSTSHEGVSSSDVLKVAAAWLAWVEKGGEQTD